MIPLNQIQVSSPCRESWSEMAGDESVRFCNRCRSNVYNLSAMTADEAQALVAEREGKLCVRFYQRCGSSFSRRMRCRVRPHPLHPRTQNRLRISELLHDFAVS
ncbi:hypothetical protein [Capsulimonas corticalis]|uniref:hypothetical protein n=1 Tax=Capsulimonas corticalis TaxID=2219043 RepID=UPI000F64572B|nr:hypothetical protein [Capsulimonas corticalis]